MKRTRTRRHRRQSRMFLRSRGKFKIRHTRRGGRTGGWKPNPPHPYKESSP